MRAFEDVREQLLKSGIAARHVDRYVVELREHLADLTTQERAKGPVDAGLRARTLMGSDTQLVQAMLDRSPPRALSVKAPWAVFVVLPVVAILAASWLIAASMMRLMMPVRSLLPADMPGGYQALIAAATIFTGYIIGPVLAAACIAVALRQRLSSAWVWTGLLLIAVFSGLFTFHAPDGPHGMYRAAVLVTENGHVNGPATLAMIAVRAGVLFGLATLAWRTLKVHQTSAA